MREKKEVDERKIEVEVNLPLLTLGLFSPQFAESLE